MESWITGIRELATLIAPLGTDHSLLPIVAHVEGESLTTAWAENGADSEILTPSSTSEFTNLRGGAAQCSALDLAQSQRGHGVG